MAQRPVVKRDITKAQFFELLRRASQPIESDSGPIETSAVPQDDGCNETDTHLDTTEDTSG